MENLRKSAFFLIFCQTNGLFPTFRLNGCRSSSRYNAQILSHFGEGCDGFIQMVLLMRRR